MSFSFKSIQIRILFWAGLCLFLVAGTLVTYTSITVRNTAVDEAKAQAVAQARQQAASLKGLADSTLDTSRMLAEILTTSNQSKIAQLNREQVVELLNGILAHNSSYLGVYTAWEPDAFDGKDASYANSAGHDATGRFIPYVVRAGSEIQLTPLMDYETAGVGDYYLIPKRTQQEQVIEPYIYPIDGEDVLLTSLIAPIVINSQFQGIAGVDFRPTFRLSVTFSLRFFEIIVRHQ